MDGVILRKYGEAATINFELFEVDGIDFRVDAVHASGDTVIMKDEGTEANTTNSFTDEGTGYSLVLTATEMQAARIVVYIVDQTATKAWLDKAIRIETYGNASAQHAFDLDTASTAQTGDSFARIGANGAGLTAVPWNASWDAEVQSECSDALTAYNAVATSDLPTNFVDMSISATTGLVDITQTAADKAWSTTTRILTASTNFNDISPSEVNAEVVDVLETDTHAESASVPAATSSLKDKITYMFTLNRNKMTQTATTTTLRNDADSANISTSTVSDDGTTFTKGEHT